MDKFEKLVNSIMKECEADGEPVTREEAEEMARMEMGEKEIKRYEQAEKPKKERKPKERKVDAEKGFILVQVAELLNELGADISAIKTETEIKFGYGDNSYTLKLTKHRPPK